MWKQIVCIKSETPGLCCIIIYILEITKEFGDAANIYQYCPHMFQCTHTHTAILERRDYTLHPNSHELITARSTERKSTHRLDAGSAGEGGIGLDCIGQMVIGKYVRE